MTAFKVIWTQEFWRCVSAEFFAMLLFVLLGLGSTINWGLSRRTPRAHINPAVTAAMVVTRTISLSKAIFYLLAQCFGVHCWGRILYGITPASVRGGMGVTTVHTSISAGALVVELFITFQLVFTVFSTCDHKRNDLKGSSSLAIGLSVIIGPPVCCTNIILPINASDQRKTLAGLFPQIPYTGASMNPARTFGPAMVTWSWDHHWGVLGGSTMGGTLAAALYEYMFCPDPEMKENYSETFIHTPYSAAKLRHGSVTAQEPPFTVMDVERAERNELKREVSGDVLSSV
ncbi:hypothetical protein KUCAC02_022542 [Chaenocephalus aceratus]|uniref:Uncharacterized protein n=1 Tax=Chaenocephalus aceratus TaxID=36190 RepID=A0ACB9XME5_CHAAC|nr:hypothetical protein KUCAC02_022542 [Chaenocephalus aceratus]